MSNNNNSDLNAKTNVVGLTQAELDSVSGGTWVDSGLRSSDWLSHATESLHR
jgi:hypothetical protein